MRHFPTLSMWQPFASLVFTRHKRHETRGRPIPQRLRGARIAIHATLAIPPRRLICAGLEALAAETFGEDWRRTLPRGAFIGTVQLLADYSTGERRPHSEADHIAGDWGPRRYAWALDAPIKLAVPIPGRGRQSWFSVELP